MTSDAQSGSRVLGSLRSADGDKTVLAIEERGLPVEHLAAYGAGWQIHAEDLAAHLAGAERCDMKTRWSELISAYRDQAANLD
jgi:hypothetical protein